VTAVSTLLTAVGLLGYSVSPNIWVILLCAIPLGLGAGAVDAGLNNYVALHYKASHISYLHCFYGVGVTVSPVFMSLALAQTGDWHIGYRAAGLVQLGIALTAVLSVGLWGRVAGMSRPSSDGTASDGEVIRVVPFREQARNRGIRWAWLIFTIAVTLEVLAGSWGSTYLVKQRGMLPHLAAVMTALYYFGLAMGRFLSGLLSHKLSAWKIITLSMVIWPLSLILFLLPLPPAVSGVGLLFAGLGIGPLYPNLVYLTPRNFGREISQSVMGTQSAMAYLGLMAVPPLFSFLVGQVGVGLFIPFLAFLFLLLLSAVIFFVRLLKKQGRFDG
jgi:fucose permease